MATQVVAELPWTIATWAMATSRPGDVGAGLHPELAKQASSRTRPAPQRDRGVHVVLVAGGDPQQRPGCRRPRRARSAPGAGHGVVHRCAGAPLGIAEERHDVDRIAVVGHRQVEHPLGLKSPSTRTPVRENEPGRRRSRPAAVTRSVRPGGSARSRYGPSPGGGIDAHRLAPYGQPQLGHLDRVEAQPEEDLVHVARPLEVHLHHCREHPSGGGGPLVDRSRSSAAPGCCPIDNGGSASANASEELAKAPTTPAVQTWVVFHRLWSCTTRCACSCRRVGTRR